MLYAQNRLRKEKDFERVFKKGEKAKGDSLFLRFAENNLSQSRFGIVVSKKVSLKATERNRIKRKIGEAIREILPSVKKGWDVVVLVAPSFLSRGEDLCEAAVKDIFKKAKLLRE